MAPADEWRDNWLHDQHLARTNVMRSLLPPLLPPPQLGCNAPPAPPCTVTARQRLSQRRTASMAGAGPRVQYPSPSCCSSHSPRPTAPPRRPFGPPFALLLLQLLPPASRPLLDTAQQEVAQPLPAGVSPVQRQPASYRAGRSLPVNSCTKRQAVPCASLREASSGVIRNRCSATSWSRYARDPDRADDDAGALRPCTWIAACLWRKEERQNKATEVSEPGKLIRTSGVDGRMHLAWQRSGADAPDQAMHIR